jgi:hypothetical protein
MGLRFGGALTTRGGRNEGARNHTGLHDAIGLRGSHGGKHAIRSTGADSESISGRGKG